MTVDGSGSLRNMHAIDYCCFVAALSSLYCSYLNIFASIARSLTQRHLFYSNYVNTVFAFHVVSTGIVAQLIGIGIAPDPEHTGV